MTMVVGMFENLLSAQRAVADLVGSGYRRNAISVLVRNARPANGQLDEDDDGDGEEEHGALARATHSATATSVLAGGPLGAAMRMDSCDSTEHAVMHTLTNAGLKPAAARFFADAICNGAILVAVHCPECEVRDARDILDIYTDTDDSFELPRRSSAAGRRGR